MKSFTSSAQRTGELGEWLACRFLAKKGINVLERNYTRKWGEIDIIANKGNVLHFIEVKCVSRENMLDPLDHIDENKKRRLARTIESYISAKRTGRWQFDVIAMRIDRKGKKAAVRYIENVILGGRKGKV